MLFNIIYCLSHHTVLQHMSLSDTESDDTWQVPVPDDCVYRGRGSSTHIVRELELLVEQGDAASIQTVDIDSDCIHTIPRSLVHFTNLIMFIFEGTRLWQIDVNRIPASVQHLSLYSGNLDYEGLIQGLPLLLNLRCLHGLDIADIEEHTHVVLPVLPSLRTIQVEAILCSMQQENAIAVHHEHCRSVLSTFMANYSSTDVTIEFSNTSTVQDIIVNIHILENQQTKNVSPSAYK